MARDIIAYILETLVIFIFTCIFLGLLRKIKYKSVTQKIYQKLF